MAIKFFNIRSKEVKVAETEPQLAALWSSSDRGPNVSQGQDFGWRLAPEVVVEMKRIKQDQSKLLEIAGRYNVPYEDLGEKEILQYISDKTDAAKAPLAADADYSDEYNQEIRRLEHQHDVPEEELKADFEQESEPNVPKTADEPEPPKVAKIKKAE